MRLLHTTKPIFGEFFDSQVPEYCILSHRWGEGELQYSDVRDRQWRPGSQAYKKLYGACWLASQRGFDWIWIDTCCIDKTSSAELTEAINSMFNYYSKARLCLAYLSDVPGSTTCHAHHPKRSRVDYLRESVWFSRGWTLQELLAPAHLEFFDQDFRFIGSKAQMSQVISDITGIASKYLDGRRRVNDASIATRMSWASDRETTRLEDQSYSLLGILGVNMPLLYGEGNSAFLRLQQQLLENSDDESLFAWTCDSAHDDEPFGLLAESPHNFRHSRNVRQTRVTGDPRQSNTWTSGCVEYTQGYKDEHDFLEYEGSIPINCKRRSVFHDGKEEKTVAVRLRKVKGTWYRFYCNRFWYTSERFSAQNFQTFAVAQPNCITTPRLSCRSQHDMISVVRSRMQQERHEVVKRRQRKEGLKVLKWTYPFAIPIAKALLERIGD